jgi:chromate reductase, NAD(P)H dehydrogenase (quinone)
MPDALRVLVLPGSARRDSFNKKLARVAAAQLVELGAQPTFVDPADHPLPLYDGDLEESSGLPENARRLKVLFRTHPAVVFVSPEYNGSPTPLLKNVIDWCSRAEGNEKQVEALVGKTAALLSASPGALGGMRGLVQLRMCLAAIRVLVVPEDFSLAKAHEAFADDGSLRDAKQTSKVRSVMERLVAVARAVER